MDTSLKFRSVILKFSRMLSDEINTLLLEHQLNYSLWQVLHYIQQHQPCTSTEIAEYLNISRPSIAKRIQPLLKLQAVSQHSEADRRVRILRLTDSGQQLVIHCMHKIDQLEQELLEQSSDTDIQLSIKLIHQLTQQLQHKKSGVHHEH
ncbi:MarR family transcriptional regulator [Acinetobacter chinensis]|uniref:MarR family transcriptional regulator n=1 Tax=Acinetobacter chinensis TaxID=2004650 RepID=A0A3B7LVH5_9GAMM|nr:MarR family transcriptional regulator [Acinetobacter chinensis]AXY56776.1 MarR family transcriptional regulator [Acinetobacter chinensis]